MTPLARTVATVRRRGYTAALLAFRRSPAPVRRALVRAATPGFTVGAVVAVQHGDTVLFLRQPHREGWSLPGGLLDRGESAAAAVVREVREETGLRIEVGLPLTCQVNSPLRRVDVIYRIEVDHRPEVRVGGEAKASAWYRLDQIPSADGPTHEIVALLQAVPRPGATSGRLLSDA
jgi:ADP-ribose pyrophosphatase YjhB (NUDIX family)